MGGFLNIGGSSAKTDRGNQLTGFQTMKNIFNYAIPQGQKMVGQAGNDIGSAVGYFKNIMSGSRATISQTMAPEINATRAGADAQKRNTEAFGTARGGGTNAVNAGRDAATQATIDNAIFKARPAAAEEVGKLGTAEMSEAQNMLGLGANTATNYTQLAGTSRVNSQAINQQMVGDVTGAIEAALMMA